MSYVPYTKLALSAEYTRPGFFTPYSSLLENKTRPGSISRDYTADAFLERYDFSLSCDMSFQRAVNKTFGTLTLVRDTVDYGLSSIQCLLAMVSNALQIVKALNHGDDAAVAWSSTKHTFKSAGDVVTNAAYALGTPVRFVFTLLKEILALVTRLLATAIVGLLSMCLCMNQQRQDIATPGQRHSVAMAGNEGEGEGDLSDARNVAHLLSAST